MTISYWLASSAKKLDSAGISTAQLDALVLLEDVLGKDRTHLLAHPKTPLQGQALQKLDWLVARRAQHEPLAYIRGKTEFYGRVFKLDKNVLEPRPETETMIDLALQVIGDRLEVKDIKPVAADIGTGSGALAITLKLEKPKARVYGIDIDENCLTVAQKNADKYKVSVDFLQGNLLEPIYNLKPITPNLLLCNLPYVPDDFHINESAGYEPKVAIFGGPDGLDLYRKLFSQISSSPKKPSYILAESLPFQHKLLASIAKKSGYKLAQTDDFIQVFKHTR